MAETGPDDTRRVELTPRQIAALDGYQQTWLSQDSTEEQRIDAAGLTMGYLRAAMHKRS
jgi:hypothetical protein